MLYSHGSNLKFVRVVPHRQPKHPIRTARAQVAWVDNGNLNAEAVASRFGRRAVEHMRLEVRNMGLAWGLNTLFFDLCQAPFGELGAPRGADVDGMRTPLRVW
jgi:hypothetical protein